jgi:hypothetical protein
VRSISEVLTPGETKNAMVLLLSWRNRNSTVYLVNWGF